MIITFDVETTGLPNQIGTVNGKSYKVVGEVTQLSVLVADDNFNIKDFKSFYCRPSEPICDKSSEVTGITNSFIEKHAKYPVEKYLMEDLHDIFYSKGNIFVGHNIKFDMGVLNSTLNRVSCKNIDFGREITSLKHYNSLRNNFYCTMKAGHRRFPKLNGGRWPKLTQLVNELNLSKDSIDGLYNKLVNYYGLCDNNMFHNSDYDTLCTFLCAGLLNK